MISKDVLDRNPELAAISKPRKMAPVKSGSEYTEQCALFSWAATVEAQLPALCLMFAIPNGEKRDKVTGARLKRAGVRAGVPDIFLSYPAHGQHGLYIEMKHGRNAPSPAQNNWLDALDEAGYRCVVCWSWQDAARELCRYLGVAPERFGV